MLRSFGLILALSFVTGTCVSESRAQVPANPVPSPASAVPASPAPAGLEFLQELPRPADVPSSLMEAAPPQGPTGAAAEAPYFQADPLLDPAGFPQPGWFSAAEVQLTKPHVSNVLVPEVPIKVPGVAGPVTPSVGSAPLNWTAAPKLTVGYRLPSGFGELLMSYRFFDTQGSGAISPAVVGTSGLSGVGAGTASSRLSLNQFDFDYSSREYSPYPQWGMRWWVGLRLTDFFYSTVAAAAAGPGGIDSVQATDFTIGGGGHLGVELDRRFGDSGLMMVNKVDVADVYARMDQSFTASSSSLGTGGVSGFQRATAMPYVNWQFGLGYNPPSMPNAHLFMGSQLEYWWNVGSDFIDSSRMNVGNYGIVWQASFNF